MGMSPWDTARLDQNFAESSEEIERIISDLSLFMLLNPKISSEEIFIILIKKVPAECLAVVGAILSIQMAGKMRNEHHFSPWEKDDDQRREHDLPFPSRGDLSPEV